MTGWPICPDCGAEIPFSSCQQPADELVEAIVLAAHRKFGCPVPGTEIDATEVAEGDS